MKLHPFTPGLSRPSVSESIVLVYHSQSPDGPCPSTSSSAAAVPSSGQSIFDSVSLFCCLLFKLFWNCRHFASKSSVFLGSPHIFTANDSACHLPSQTQQNPDSSAVESMLRACCLWFLHVFIMMQTIMLFITNYFQTIHHEAK